MQSLLLKLLSSRRALYAAALVALSLAVSSQPRTAPLPVGVAIRDMTWIEVRTAIQQGFTTVIVPTGGLEQNGPHMIIGKHDYIVGEAAGRIARDVGHTLVAPVVSYVPEGDYAPPTGHMRFPGTMGVPEPVFDGMLDGIANSLKAAGFKTICFIGDHGQSQAVQAAVAERLSKAWAADGVRVVNIAGYYDDKAQIKKLLDEGRTAAEIGRHASVIDTSELLSVNPEGVDLGRYRTWTLSLEPSGVAGDPSSADAALGKRLLDMRVAAAAAEIRALTASQ